MFRRPGPRLRPAKSAPPGAVAPGEVAPPRAALPVVTFAKLRLLVIDGEKSRDRDATLRLGADGLDILDQGKTVETALYQDVIGLFHSHSREPRWTMSDGAAVPVAKTSTKFGFLKGMPDWITIRTRRAFIPLRVQSDAVAKSDRGARVAHRDDDRPDALTSNRIGRFTNRPYSCLRTLIGSTRAARLAGMMLASAITAIMTAAVPAKATGSSGDAPNSLRVDDLRRHGGGAGAGEAADRVGISACRRIMPTTAEPFAPSVIRIPISRRRNATT